MILTQLEIDLLPLEETKKFIQLTIQDCTLDELKAYSQVALNKKELLLLVIKETERRENLGISSFNIRTIDMSEVYASVKSAYSSLSYNHYVNDILYILNNKSNGKELALHLMELIYLNENYNILYCFIRDVKKLKNVSVMLNEIANIYEDKISNISKKHILLSLGKDISKDKQKHFYHEVVFNKKMDSDDFFMPTHYDLMLDFYEYKSNEEFNIESTDVPPIDYQLMSALIDNQLNEEDLIDFSLLSKCPLENESQRLFVLDITLDFYLKYKYNYADFTEFDNKVWKIYESLQHS